MASKLILVDSLEKADTDIMTLFGTLTLFPANFRRESLRGILVWLYARFKGKQTTDAAKKKSTYNAAMYA